MSNIQIRARLNDGIYSSDREAHWQPESVATLELALLRLAQYRDELCGGFGSIGCGDGGNIYVEDATGLWRADLREDRYIDGEMEIVEWIPVDEDGDEDERDGQPEVIEDDPPAITYSDVLDACAPVWDGNNLVGGDPVAYMAAHGVDSVEGEAFVINSDGEKNIWATANDGWTILHSTDECESTWHDDIRQPEPDWDAAAALLDAADINYQQCDLSINDSHGITECNISYAVANEDLQRACATINKVADTDA